MNIKKVNINIDTNKLGQRIRKLRKERGLSQIELGKSLNVSSNNVSLWERGDVLPSLEMAWRFSLVFDVSIDSLVK